MPRCYVSKNVHDTAGNVFKNALVTVWRDEACTQPVTDMYAAATGGAPITELESDDQGDTEAWFTTPKIAWYKVTDGGDPPTAHYPLTPGDLRPFGDFVEAVLVLRSPEISVVFPLVDYGAEIGGVVSADAAFAKAKAAAIAAGGGTLKLPPGALLQTVPWVLESGISLEGAAWWLSSLVHTTTTWGANHGAVEALGVDSNNREVGIAVRDLKVQGAGSFGGTRNTVDEGILFDYCDDVIVERVWVNKVLGEAIYAQRNCNNVKFIGNKVTDCAGNAYNFNGPITNGWVADNYAKDIGGSGFEGPGNDAFIDNNTFEGYGGWGVALGNWFSPTRSERVTVTNNNLRNGTNGSLGGLSMVFGPSEYIVMGNDISGNAGRGMNLSGATTHSNETRRSIVAFNMVSNNNQTTNAQQVLLEDLGHVLYTGNMVWRDEDEETGGVASRGIEVTGTGTNLVIEGCAAWGHDVDIKRDSAASCILGRNYVTSGWVDGDTYAYMTHHFVKANYAAAGEALTPDGRRVRIPYPWRVHAYSAILDSAVTSGTLRIRHRTGGVASDDTGADFSITAAGTGGFTVPPQTPGQVEHAAGTDLSGDVAITAAVTASGGTGIGIDITIRARLDSPNALV